MSLKKVIPIYWHRSINFGDKLSPYVVEKLTNEQTVYCDHVNDCNRLMITGSILSGGNLEKSIIWGNGFCFYQDPVYKPLEILAVRGPFTKSKFDASGIFCPDVFGDPGLLMPKLYNPKADKKYKYGIAAHIVDYEQAKSIFGESPDFLVIDLRKSVEEVINDMLSCEKIFSSSLHGIIVPHAYGIPCAWVKFSDKIIGDGFKFHDYFQSVMDSYPLHAVEVKNKDDISIASMIEPGRDISEKLLNTFPIK